MSTTVLIVDDHAGFRSWTRSLLETEGFQVVGESADGASAVSAARDLRPQLVLLDVMLPDTTGFVVAEELAALVPPPAVVLVSSHEASDYGQLVAQSSALGFITKLELTVPRLTALIGADA